MLRRTFRFDEHVSNASVTIFFLLEFPTFSSLQGATVGASTGIIVAVVVCVIALVTVIALYLARKFARRRSRVVQVSSKRDDHDPAVVKRESFAKVRTPRHSMEDIVDADIAERIGDLAVSPSRLFIEKEVGEGWYNIGILFNNQTV